MAYYYCTDTTLVATGPMAVMLLLLVAMDMLAMVFAKSKASAARNGDIVVLPMITAITLLDLDDFEPPTLHPFWRINKKANAEEC